MTTPDDAAHTSPASLTTPGWVGKTTLFLSGQTISLLGSSLVQYAIMWHLTITTKSGWVLTLSIIFGFVPQAIISIFGGVWADRHNRKFLIMGSDGVIALSTLALALLWMSGVEDLWLVFLALAVRSAGAGIQTPAVGALLPQLVPTEKLIRVNGINTSIQSGIMLLSPPIAMWLYTSFELQAVLFVDVATAAIGISLLAIIAVPTLVRSDDGDQAGYLEDLRAGLAYVWGHPVVRRVLIFFSVVFILVVPPSYLTPLMVVRTFGDGSADDSWKLMVTELSFSIGMILGGGVLAVWGGLKNRMTMIVGSSLIFGALSIALGFSTNLLVFFGIMFLFGITVPFLSTTSQTTLQEQVEPTMQGRVFGLMGIVMAIGMPLGMLAFGPLADVVSVETLLIVSGLLAILAAVAAGWRAPKVYAVTGESGVRAAEVEGAS